MIYTSIPKPPLQQVLEDLSPAPTGFSHLSRAAGINLQEFAGHGADGLLDLFLGLGPLGSPQFIQGGGITRFAGITLDEIETVDRKIELIAPQIFQEKELPFLKKFTDDRRKP
jgi:hypothetical protein